MAIIEKITVQLQLLTDKFTKDVKSAEDRMKKFNSQIQRNNTILRKSNALQKANRERIITLKEQTHGFGQVMGMSQERFKAFNQQGFKFNTVGGKVANRIRMMTHGMRGFRMEMLGVMFFGMSLLRIFGGLMKTSMEWMGVTDVLSATLGSLFMPVAEKLLDWALRFMDWVDQLTPGQQEMINNFVLWGAIIGGLLTVIGTFALGIGSLILVFGKLFGVSAPLKILGKLIIGLFTGITAPILVVIAIIVAIVIGMVIAWKENFMGMKKIVSDFIQGVKDFFSGLITIFKGIFLIIKGIFLGDWSMIWEGVKKIFSGAIKSILAFFQIIVTGLAAIGIGIIRVVWSLIKLILAPFIWLYNKLIGHSIIPDLVNGIIEWFRKIPTKIINAFKGLGKKIANSFKDMIPNWMLKIFKKGISFGGKVASMLGFAQGGIVPGPRGAPVPAIVHGGEKIIPVGGGNASGSPINVTIHANVSSDYDVRRLADELKRYWVSDFERVSQGRTI